MYPDFKELLSILNAHRVKYLVVGAYAASVHAQQRATKDLDILVKADADNAKDSSMAAVNGPMSGQISGGRVDRTEGGSYLPRRSDRRKTGIWQTAPGHR
jgi:galactose mutarotase-like enzyme